MSDTKAVIRKYDPEECVERRLACIEQWVYPAVKEAFKMAARAPSPVHLQSAVLFVAQYWDDEADDAVHRELVYSVSHEPQIDRYLKALERQEAAGNDDDGYAWSSFIEGPEVGLPGDDFWDLGYYGWDDNQEAIPLFAAFCKEGCHQEMGMHEAYTPVAIIRRDGSGEGLKTDIIGEMLRPWLDGVRPEWEGERGPALPAPADDDKAQTKSLPESLLDKWRRTSPRKP